MNTTHTRRQQATERHRAAMHAINATFDAVDQLSDVLDRARATDTGDPLRDAEELLSTTTAISAAVEAVQQAALEASKHDSKTNLAKQLGTSTRRLFPPAATAVDTPESPDDGGWTSTDA